MTDEESLLYAELNEKRWRSHNLKNPGPDLTDEEGAELFRLRRLHRQELIEEYGLLVPWLSELLYRHDPVHLASCGVPKDEYKNEAFMILPELDRLLSEGRTEPEPIREVVYKVFEQMFNRRLGDPERYHPTCVYITDEVYANIAHEISTLMNSLGSILDLNRD